jgi:prepilin-type N-terminal cleavage/methylation domain-containing protein
LKASRISGFTLLEMLVALFITALAMTIVWQTFSVSIQAWRKGEDFLAEMQHGDFVMEMLADGLRSAAYFDASGDTYGFRLENRQDGKYPNDKLSWVKSGGAFLPRSAEIGRGLHRIDLSIEENDSGDPAVTARVYPHLAHKDEGEFYEGQSWEISSVVKGIDCRVYIEEDEDWSEEWEDTNSVPALLELTLYMDPLEGDDEPVKLSRAVQIPISRELKSGVIFDEAGRESGGATDAPQGEADAGSRAAAEAARRPSQDQSGRGRGAPTVGPAPEGAPGLRIQPGNPANPRRGGR